MEICFPVRSTGQERKAPIQINHLAIRPFLQIVFDLQVELLNGDSDHQVLALVKNYLLVDLGESGQSSDGNLFRQAPFHRKQEFIRYPLY